MRKFDFGVFTQPRPEADVPLRSVGYPTYRPLYWTVWIFLQPFLKPFLQPSLQPSLQFYAFWLDYPFGAFPQSYIAET